MHIIHQLLDVKFSIIIYHDYLHVLDNNDHSLEKLQFTRKQNGHDDLMIIDGKSPIIDDKIVPMAQWNLTATGLVRAEV